MGIGKGQGSGQATGLCVGVIRIYRADWQPFID